MIHQGGSDKNEWFHHRIWTMLSAEGYVLLAYDIRQHGESSVDKDNLMDLFNNPERAPRDLIAAIDYLEKKRLHRTICI